MAAKIVLTFCAQLLLVQYAVSQAAAGIGGPWGIPGAWNGLAGPGLAGPGLAGPGYGPGCGCGGVASTGGGFPVTSVSPIAPTGISIFSENAIEGPLAVGGNLPFLGTVAVEGVLPTAGSGAVSYGCGNGAVGIVSEAPIATGIVGPSSYPPAGPGYGAGFGPGLVGAGYPGYGCGCGAIY